MKSPLIVLILLVSLMGQLSYGQELTNTMAHNIKYGKTERLEKSIPDQLLNACVDVPRSNKKYNYLAISIKLKSITSLKYFIERGADLENTCTDKTPLMFAAKYGQLEMLKVLIENGAQPKATYKGRTAYDYALKFKHPEIRKYLKDLNLN